MQLTHLHLRNLVFYKFLKIFDQDINFPQNFTKNMKKNDGSPVWAIPREGSPPSRKGNFLTGKLAYMDKSLVVIR